MNTKSFLLPAVVGMFAFAAFAETTPQTLADVGSAELSGDAGVELVDRGNGTYALVFTNAQTTTFTFNSEWTVREFLVVGGGGAGGGNNGGGGGGGGVIWYTTALLDADNVQTNFSNGQSISLSVGAGGVGGFKRQGTAGGHSVLNLGGKTYTAFGGAGGASYEKQTPDPGEGGKTGCGAGCYPGKGATTGNSSTMPNLPGYYGTSGGAYAKWKASNQDWSMSGGGGGAGEPGGDAVNTGAAFGMGGKGGDGLPCSITGEEIYYAAGGGGGDNYHADEEIGNAQGGRGGGGCGSSQIGRLNPEDSTVAPSESHATGFGCGGGGGTGGNGATAAGGNGSAGIVVLAIYPTGSTPQEDDPDDPDPGVFDWAGGADGDWDDPANWVGGVVPSTGAVIRVSGTATITRGEEAARVSGATIEIGEDGSFTLVSGSVMPIPTLDLTQPVAGRAITVEPGTFGGISGEAFTVQWKRGASLTSKSYQNLSTERSITPTTADYGYFFQCTAKGSNGVQLWQKEFFFSKLPVLYMTTNDGQTPTKNKEEHAGHVFVQGNETWASPYDGAMVIKMRGNTTTGSTYRKKPWKLKLDSKTKMFGIAKSKHWVLLANDKEKSAMRNKLAYDLANEIGSLGMESTWVECFLNGTYQGLYLFAEHIRVASDRVDIFDWEGAGEDAADAIAAANGFSDEYTVALEGLMATNLAWVTSGRVTFKSAEYDVPEDFRNLDISGGYLVESSKEYDEVSKFSITSGTLTFESMLKSPEFLKTNPDMFAACRTRVEDYLAALASPDGYNEKGAHWSQLADLDSMATYLLALELFGNDDAEKKSRFFYWDVGGPIQFGPVWDFDWGVGNTLVDKNIGDPEKWRAHNNNPRSFFREWTDDPWFCTRLRTLYWSKARDVLARIVSDGGEIDRYHDYLAEAAATDEKKWPIKADSGVARTFETDVTNLYTFLSARLVWLDQQFADVPTLMESFKKSCLQEYSSRSDLADLPSNCPYTADSEGLPIVFPNAPTNAIAKGTALRLSATVASNSAETVDVYVNGLKIGAAAPVAAGCIAAEIPAETLTEAPGFDNCVSLVARDAEGGVVSRNYALVRTINEKPLGDGYEFILEGDYTGAQTISPTGTECRVILKGANVPGGLLLDGTAKFEFVPDADTVNAIGSISGPTATLKLDGAGTVLLEGADTLASISNLHVKAGTFAVKSTGVATTKTPVVNVLGYAKQSGGTIDIDLSVAATNQIYGIFLANKDLKDADGNNLGVVYAEISGGTFQAKVGATKSSALYVDKGSVLTTFKGADTVVTAELAGTAPRLVSTAGDLEIKNGSFTVTMPESCATIADARVFKTDKDIEITGGLFDIDVRGPGAEVFSADESGGTIKVEDGTFELVADDDCFSAMDRITVDGGSIFAVSLNNDVLDSNGDMRIRGGTILAFATADGHEAFDVDPEATAAGENPHVLTVSNAVVFAAGGKNADWPYSLVLGEGTKAVVIEDAAASAYAGMYLTLVSPATKLSYAAKLPAFPSTECAIFATAPGYDGATPSTSATAPAKGDRGFHDLYVWSTEATNQENLRFHTIYGSTNEGSEDDGTFGDVGEYIVLTNVSDQVVSLAGLKLTTAKKGKAPSCSLVLTDGTVPAFGSVRLDQADFVGKGWTKITNGDIQIALKDAEDNTIQSGASSFGLYPQCDGGGAALVANRFFEDTLEAAVLEATMADWIPSFTLEPAEIEAPAFVTDGTALRFDGEPGTTGAKLLMTIANPVEGAYYTVFVSETLDGAFTAEADSLQFPGGSETYTLTIEADKPTKFARIVVSTTPFQKGANIPTPSK